MSKILESVILGEEKERMLISERARRYAKLQYLEREILRESIQMREELTVEELRSVATALETEELPVPEFLSVRDVAKLTDLTPQIVRRHCMNGKYKGYQVAGENSTWRIESEQFKDNPHWISFLIERNEARERSKKVAVLAEQLWEHRSVEDVLTEE
jgi:hypothetical protein